ncbi:MAG: imidazole glycerol phosphate synthase subunit HisH [Chitinophagaceae bacterium]|nr:imidazole glycerol phosphate synthase subunit HisH [Chitinophagaceae bacterium]
MVVILDYSIGNLNSIKNILKRVGINALITNKVKDVLAAEKIILPGVGSFDHGISNLRDMPYFSALEEQVLVNKVPILGICLGAQLLAERSDEGVLSGLGWIKGEVKKFDSARMMEFNLKIPHMGWSEIEVKKTSALFSNMYEDPRFYFVHSYHWCCANSSNVLATALYGYEFTAGVEYNNIAGVQFHPEKSHKYGMKLLENFVKYF